MTMRPKIPVPEHGRLAENILHFARALRAAGIPVGTARAVLAVEAVAAGGFERREDFYHTLAACLLSRPEHRAVFDQCFHMFWRDPQILEKMMGMLLPEMRAPPHEREKKAGEQRAAEALTQGADRPAPEAVEREPDEIELDASLTFSEQERLSARDFEQMTAAEMAQAKRAIARLELPVRPFLSRRTRAAPRGALADWRRTMRASLRGGGVPVLARREKRERYPALVALCDISGSMAAYSRMLLHFLHAAANAKGAGWAKVHVFTFATRLTNITRHLPERDVDEALARAGQEARDWEGGTRIGACLEAFNRDWSRRVLGQGAVVLLITDGLDRDDPGRLAREAERLHLSCRRLIWLNPLLRWDGFEARAQGARALLPHVDAFVAAHNIASLEGLAETIARAEGQGEKARLMAGLRAA
ncbi:MAG TPA: VWA domain-containing protein [Paracoccaceae bacterium]|nr:VWA domain-containing protein [Paracoccaceae bacterium]